MARQMVCRLTDKAAAPLRDLIPIVPKGYLVVIKSKQKY